MKKIKNILNRYISPALTAKIVSNGKYKYPKHIAFLDSVLLNAVAGKSKRLIINLPPRHGKSELISKYFPFWFLGNFPDKRVILCSYEATFAQSWGRKVRDLIKEFGELCFGISVSDSSSAAGYFEIDKHSGSISCAGAGGPITGKGADIFIIDDPIKNDEEANSHNQREKLWDWFRSTAYTRLEPDGVMILMMTRWHEDDLCGRIIKDFADSSVKWEIINIPAISKDNDVLKRLPGKALWSNRFSLPKLLEIEKSVGSYWFNSLYQQSPVSSDGDIFNKKYFRYFYTSDNDYVLKLGQSNKIIKKSNCRIYAAVDLAISLSTNADYTVAVIVAITNENEILLLDVKRKKIEPSDHLKFINEIYSEYKPIIIGIESVQYQTALVKSAMIYGLPAKELKPDSDKLTRALPMAARIESGMVYFKSDAVWLREFESELMKFPRDKHDDQVDALSYILQFIMYSSNSLPSGKSTLR
jgi:predicted phage terminase large subunit-like protein